MIILSIYFMDQLRKIIQLLLQLHNIDFIDIILMKKFKKKIFYLQDPLLLKVKEILLDKKNN